jgi:hypothetical protein
MSECPAVTLPDWNIADNYLHLRESLIGQEGLAWECLRRDPDYQADWHLLNSNPEQLKDRFGNPPGLAELQLFGGASLGFFDPPRKAGETAQEWFSRNLLSGIEPKHIPVWLYLRRKWRLKSDLYDPNLNALQLATQLGIPIEGKVGSKGPKWGIFEVPTLTVVERQDQLAALNLVTDDSSGNHDVSAEAFSQKNILFIIDVTKSKGAIKSAIGGELDRLKAKNTANHSSTAKRTGLQDALRCWDSQVASEDIKPGSRIEVILPAISSHQRSKTFDEKYALAEKLICDRAYIGWFD